MPGLRVTAGYAGHMSPLAVNEDSKPLHISNDEFEGDVTVRIKGFEPPPGETAPSDPESGYFAKHPSFTWSIAVAGRVKKSINADDLRFGNSFDRPIRDNLPYGTAIALKAFRLIDPSLEQDLYADKPWAFSPLVATMPVLNVVASAETPAWSAEQPSEDASALFPADDPDRGRLVGNAAARRRLFNDAAVRQAVEITPDLHWTCDFAQGMIDFAHLRLTIPVANVSFDLTKYWDGQPVRFVAQNRDGTRELFRVEFVIADEAIVAEKRAAGHDVAGAEMKTPADEAVDEEID